MRRAIFILASATTLCMASSAIASASKADVADAKASLLKGADEAFLDLWSRRANYPGSERFTASQMRQLARWGFITYSVGLCGTFQSVSDRAEYEERSDSFAQSIAAGSQDGLKFVRGFIENWRQSGIKGRADFDAGGLAPFCESEMPAVSELIREM